MKTGQRFYLKRDFVQVTIFFYPAEVALLYVE